MASFAASFIPGVGPLLSKGMDIVGNLVPGSGSGSETPVSDMLTQMGAAPINFLGSSPATQALSTASGFLGIGGSAPGVFGIGDGKPGIFGIGTGANQARNAAEVAARTGGATEAAARYAGEAAAAAAKAGPAEAESSNTTMLLIGGAILALLAL